MGQVNLVNRKEILKMEVMNTMGMTDKQFNGFVRFVLDDIREVLEGMQESKEKEKLEKVADNLQKTLED
jgi:DNA gyrase/topoisomerase IV subunit A